MRARQELCENCYKQIKNLIVSLYAIQPSRRFTKNYDKKKGETDTSEIESDSCRTTPRTIRATSLLSKVRENINRVHVHNTNRIQTLFRARVLVQYIP